MKGLAYTFCSALAEENEKGSYRMWERVFASLAFLTKASFLCRVASQCATQDSILSLVYTGVPFPGRPLEGRRAVKASVHRKRGSETDRSQLFISRCLDILTAAVNGQGLRFKLFTYCFFIPSVRNQKSVSRYFSLNAWKAQPERRELYANNFLGSAIPGSWSEGQEKRDREKGRANARMHYYLICHS